jgi:hypothetical protein
MNYKHHLSIKGFIYNKEKNHWVKGKGWGKAYKVYMVMKGLFEIKDAGKIVFSDFVKTFEEFKELIKKHTDD